MIYDDNIGFVEYVNHMGDDLSVVNSARVSFGKHKEELDEKDKKLIRYLIKNRHTSTLEHCTVTFRFKVPLFVRSQHHRHRTWSYNEVSRRYTSENIQFYIPKTFYKQHKVNRQASAEDSVEKQQLNTYVFEAAYRSGYAAYRELIRNGVSREQARMILPQNLYTEYYGTVNLSNLLKFIDLRLDSHAQYEIQVVAQACLNIASGLFPETVKSWKDLKQE